MATKLNEIFASLAEKLEDFRCTISKDCSNYEFEASFNALIRNFSQSVFQSMVGNIPKYWEQADHSWTECWREK
jgi:hypothetical protein